MTGTLQQTILEQLFERLAQDGGRTPQQLWLSWNVGWEN